jgi:hypothetical protein
LFLYSSEPSPEPPFKNPGTVIARKFGNTGTVNVTKILRGVIITVNFADQGILDKELHQRRPDLYLFTSQLTPVSRYPLTSLGMGQIRRAGRENPDPEILGFVTLVVMISYSQSLVVRHLRDRSIRIFAYKKTGWPLPFGPNSGLHLI